VPFAFIDGMVAQITQHMTDGGQGFWISLHIIDPGEIGIVKHAGVRRMPAGVHHRAGRGAYCGGGMVIVECNPAGIKTIPVG